MIDVIGYRAAGIFLAFLTALLPAAAVADELSEPRWIDGAGAASDCIGAATSPLCAVETLIACRLRGDAGLCRAVGLELDILEAEAERQRDGPRGPDPFTVLTPHAVEYRVNYPGDATVETTRVAIALRIHGADRLTWPEGGWRRLTFELRQEGGVWGFGGVRWQPRLRFVGPDTATSPCLGDTSRPVCTVETHIACRVRSDEALCAAAGRVEGRHFRPHDATVAYLVKRIHGWEPPEQPAPGQSFYIVETRESTQWQPGDRPGEQGAAKQGGEPLFVRPHFVSVSYTLERRQGRWRVLNRTERP